MTSLSSDTTVGRLVAERAGRSRVLEHFGIDYCCRGQATLAQACKEKALDVGEVIRELASDDARGAELGDDPDGKLLDMPLGELADHIVAVHHDYLRRELPRLSALTSKVAAVHGGGHPELREVAEVFEGLRNELQNHMFKEERVLFPIIKQLEAATTMPGLHCGTVDNPIRMMMHEHDFAGTMLQRMRDLTGEYRTPSDGCASYQAMLAGLSDLEQDLHRHVHKENSILFPRASAVEAELRGGRIDQPANSR
jgi:regulator of cell morphogenesis and NO signaling